MHLKYWKWIFSLTLIINSILFSPIPVRAQEIVLPSTSDWTTEGVAINEGVDGEWDRYLWGGYSNSLVKKGDTYFLYYQGSRYYDDNCQSVAERSIGVATSRDGINWTKYSGNPVITWTSKGSIEEGAVSSGAWLGSNGNIYLYYGANTGSGCLVEANARLAVSTDGINFDDVGQVFSGSDSNVWGSGDELFPVGVYEDSGMWNVFYIPNGVNETGRLGVISGDSQTNLNTSTGVNNGAIPVWGSVSVIKDSISSYLFVNDRSTGLPINVYSFTATDPTQVSLIDSYIFSDCARGSVIYESDMQRWLMLCRDKKESKRYLVKTAWSVSPTPTPTILVSLTPTNTPKPLIGDADGDGDVDSDDYLIWESNYNLSTSSGSSSGDFNGDGRVDELDYTVWLKEYTGN